jgi:hypothetical protein
LNVALPFAPGRQIDPAWRGYNKASQLYLVGFAYSLSGLTQGKCDIHIE